VRKRSRDQRLSHEFSVVLDADIVRFMALVDERVDVVGRIARALGDRRPTHVRITRLVPGSVTLCWTNTSLMPDRPRSNCPVQVRSVPFVTVRVRTTYRHLFRDTDKFVDMNTGNFLFSKNHCVRYTGSNKSSSLNMCCD